jgi:hypothetical protein
MNKIIVNGKEYNSIDEVPKEYRVMFGDENKNGIPDFVEGILAGSMDLKNAAHTSGNPAVNANFTSFFFNGKTYNDLNQLPPDAKEKVIEGLSKLEKTGMKISEPFTQQENTEQNTYVNSNPTTADVMQEEEPALSKNFKSRLIITMLLFVMAVIYIIWLLKII